MEGSTIGQSLIRGSILSKKSIVLALIALAVFFSTVSSCSLGGKVPQSGHWSGTNIAFDVSSDGTTMTNVQATVISGSISYMPFNPSSGSVSIDKMAFNAGGFFYGTFDSATTCSGSTVGGVNGVTVTQKWTATAK
jgi:hypothetical protein